MSRYAWMDRAACAAQGPAWLEKGVDDQVDDCLDCPVRLECLLFAVDTQSTEVVLGGLRLGKRPLIELKGSPWARS